LAVPINNTPSTEKIKPIELAVPNLRALVRIRMKAFHAEEQKFLPVIEHWIYALTEMNLMNLSRQSRQHLVQQSKALTTGFSGLADSNFSA
jgi:hypothetical protein